MPDDRNSVTTTYLEITDYAQFCPAWEPWHNHPDACVMQAHEPLPDFYRFLYGTIGRDYLWLDRLHWSNTALHSYLSSPAVTLLVLYIRGTPAGYVELNAQSDEPGTEIAYFGLIKNFHGRGLGKYLLSVGIQRAFDDGAPRIWVHTCTLDGPYALQNYTRRGFVPYREVTAQRNTP